MTVSDLSYAVVIPTLGRPGLTVCLRALAEAAGPPPARVVLVDDRPPDACRPLDVEVPRPLHGRVGMAASFGRGPAAARNAGWRSASEPWIAFLDDDTVPGRTWAADLSADLAAAGPRTAGVQGRIRVPLPDGRRPTDWERGTAGLADAAWITADMAFRRTALEDVGGFDERFRRAFREDADLALRLLDAGWLLKRGERTTEHPVRPADRWVSLRVQAGNADDVLMTRLHGRDWWKRARARRGRLPAHLGITAAALAGVVCAAAGRPRAAALCAGLWLGGTAEFAGARLRPGPRTADEVTTMALTSAAIPALAAWHFGRGLLRHRQVTPWQPSGDARNAPWGPARPTGAARSPA